MQSEFNISFLCTPLLWAVGLVTLAPLGISSTAQADGDGVVCRGQSLLSTVEIAQFPGSVEIRDGLAFVSAGNDGLLIYDVHDPVEPVLISSLPLSGGCFDVFLDGDTAYCSVFQGGAGRSFVSVDISDPEFPSEVHDFSDDFGLAADVWVRDSLAYIAEDFLGFTIIDVSNPEMPAMLAKYQPPSSVKQIRVEWPYAYLTGNDDFTVVDVTDASNPTPIGNFQLMAPIDEIVVSGSMVYAATHDGKVHAINTETPSDPVLLGSLDLTGRLEVNIDSFRRASVDGTKVHLTADHGGYLLADFSDPAAPELIGVYPTPGSARAVSVAGNIAAVVDNAVGLELFDITNPTAGSPVLGTFGTDDNTYGVTVHDGIAYLADGENGLKLIDIDDPANPVLLGAYDTPGDAFETRVLDGIAYIADDFAGMLQIVDVHDPSSPVPLGSAEMLATAYGLDIQDDLIYLAGSSTGLIVYDVSDPAAPTFVGFTDTPGEAVQVQVVGSLAYIADLGGGLQIYDVSNPALPVPVGAFQEDAFNPVVDVQVVGSVAYLAKDNEGLVLVDVSNPAAPVMLSSFDWVGQYLGVRVEDARAYLSTAGGGIQVVDISDPTAPFMLGWYNTPGVASQVDVSGEVAYLAAGSLGLQIVNAGSCGMTCLADINNDGMLSSEDIEAYIVVFVDRDPAADLNGDGQFDYYDISLFQNAFKSGCP